MAFQVVRVDPLSQVFHPLVFDVDEIPVNGRIFLNIALMRFFLWPDCT